MIVRIAASTMALLWGGSALAAELVVPFEFQHGAVEIAVTVKGTPLHMLLDTGVDPSVIDLARAEALGLKVDRSEGGEVSGGGNAAHAAAFPSMIDELALEGRAVAPVAALAFDMSELSTRYGRPLDGVLGFSFLKSKILLIDYAGTNVALLDRQDDAKASVASCRRHWSTPLKSFKGDQIPVIAQFRFGKATGPISLDTGSNGGIALYQSALALPGLKAKLAEAGETAYSGARGDAKATQYRLDAPVGFGPFSLPAGQIVTLRSEPGSRRTRVANIGNPLFAAMKLKLLFDYRARRMSFYGECG